MRHPRAPGPRALTPALVGRAASTGLFVAFAAGMAGLFVVSVASHANVAASALPVIGAIAAIVTGSGVGRSVAGPGWAGFARGAGVVALAVCASAGALYAPVLPGSPALGVAAWFLGGALGGVAAFASRERRGDRPRA